MSEEEESESEEDDESVGLFVDQTPSLVSSAQFSGVENNVDEDAIAVLKDRPSSSDFATSSTQTTPATSFGQPTPIQAPTARKPLANRRPPAFRQVPVPRPPRSQVTTRTLSVWAMKYFIPLYSEACTSASADHGKATLKVALEKVQAKRSSTLQPEEELALAIAYEDHIARV